MTHFSAEAGVAVPATTKPVSMIDPAALHGLLGSRFDHWNIESVACTGSTNSDLLHRYAATHAASPSALAPSAASVADVTAGVPANRVGPIKPQLRALTESLSFDALSHRFAPQLRIATEQTAGRGRAGRPWRNAPGDSLLFSLGVVLPFPAHALTGLSLAIGVALVAGLRDWQPALTDPLALKWPNDILLGDAKLGGVLIESAGHAPYATAIVIGVGINVRTPDGASLPAVQSALPAAALFRGTTAVPTLGAMAHLLPALEQALAQFTTDGFGAFRERWWRLHRYAGQQVMLLEGDAVQRTGAAESIDAHGRLLLRDHTGQLHAIAAGDVSLRPVSG